MTMETMSPMELTLTKDAKDAKRMAYDLTHLTHSTPQLECFFHQHKKW